MVRLAQGGLKRPAFCTKLLPASVFSALEREVAKGLRIGVRAVPYRETCIVRLESSRVAVRNSEAEFP